MWFLKQYEELHHLEKKISLYGRHPTTGAHVGSKQKGFADRQIAHMLDGLESQVYNKRDEMGIQRVYKLVDTCAAEFAAKTPYYYSTFEAKMALAGGEAFSANESVSSDKKKIIVLGSGPNRIGQGIEFDYCCVHGVLAARECGYETIMINCNPETVSTDFDTADKLYLSPYFWGAYLRHYPPRKPLRCYRSIGWANCLKTFRKARSLRNKYYWHSFQSLDLAEDRGSFSTLLKEK